MQILTEKEVVAKLRVSARTLQRWRYQGVGPSYIRLGDRRVGYLEECLEAFAQGRTFSCVNTERAQTSK